MIKVLEVQCSWFRRVVSVHIVVCVLPFVVCAFAYLSVPFFLMLVAVGLLESSFMFLLVAFVGVC